MIQELSIISACLAVSLAPGALYAQSAQNITGNTTPRTGSNQPPTQSSSSVSDQVSVERTNQTNQVLFRAKTLIGRIVQTENGRELGELTEIVFHPKVGIYGMVDPGGDRQVPVPWSKVKAVTGNAIVASVDPQRFNQSPAITNDQWMAFNDPQFTQRVQDFYMNQRQGVQSTARRSEVPGQNLERGQSASSMREGDTRQQQVLFRAEPLLGRSVYTTQDQKLGDLDDIVFHPEIGIFGVIDSGNDRLVPVPWSLVTAVTEDSVVLNTSSQTFQAAPSFQDGQWSTFNQAHFTQSIRSHFAQGKRQADGTAQGGSSTFEESSARKSDAGAGAGQSGVNTITNSPNTSNLNTNTKANDHTNSSSSGQKHGG